MNKLYVKTWEWFWKHNLEDRKLIKIKGWNSCLIDDKGWGRITVEFLTWRAPWGKGYKMNSFEQTEIQK